MAEVKYWAVDTNALMRNPKIIDEYSCVITSHVLRELDKFKGEMGTLRGKQARDASNYLELKEDSILVDIKDYKFNLSSDFDPDYADNKILQACVENGYGLITGDLIMKRKAQGWNIPYVKIENKSDHYTGYLEVLVDVDADNIALIRNDMSKNPFGLITNQYLVIKEWKGKYGDDGEKVYDAVDFLRWNGESHVRLNLKDVPVKAQHYLQWLALDLLNNMDIPIKIVAGTYGSGKTYLCTKMAVHNLRKGEGQKIMMIRNPIGAGEEIGFIPGSKEEKIGDFFNPIIQHLDIPIEKLIEQGDIAGEIPFYMKGLSIENTWMMFDECQDIDIKTLKLVGTRIADKSLITFSGDWKQAENKYAHNNALMHMIEELKGNPLVGIVVLNEDVRSSASKVFADL